MRITRRTVIALATATTVAILLAPKLRGFGGEHPIFGFPWHHEHISEIALAEAGFVRSDRFSVPDTIAWHADFIDSYNYLYGMTPSLLYDLLSGEGVDRHKVSLATFEQLSHLHFDDLDSTDKVNHVWRRYLTGTLAGLIWASEEGSRGDVSAAQNILGVSLHAIQDFHSHSNWVDDPARRNRTWFETARSERERTSLWTGSYETPAHRGVRPHGVLSLECTLMLNVFSRSLGVGPFLDDVACAGVSPLANTGLCRQWKQCRMGSSTPTIDAPYVEIPAGAVYLSPPGINLDNTWSAAIGGFERGLLTRDGAWRPDARDDLAFEDCATVVWGTYARGVPRAEVDAQIGLWRDILPRDVLDYLYRITRPRECDTPAEHLFVVAKSLATRASLQWLHILDKAMRDAGKEAFWNRVKSEPGRTRPEFERYDRFPYQFLSAGPYPPVDTRPRVEHFLRILLATSDEAHSGTDADIQLFIDDGPTTIPLDYLPDAPIFLRYNDFEAGDRQVYTVGPFDALPRRITLWNRAADADDALLAFGNDLGEALESGLQTAKELGLSLISGNADYVGESRRLWTPDELARMDPRGHGYRIRVRGGDEGSYLLFLTVRRTAGSLLTLESEFTVAVDSILSMEESVHDAEGPFPSNSDEPFFFISLIPFPGTSQTPTIRPAEDTDSGEIVRDDRENIVQVTYDPIRIPSAYGMFAVAVQAWESDLEDLTDRRRLRNEFVDQIERSVSRRRSDFLATMGAALSTGWKLGEIEVTAFTRGSRVSMGKVLPRSRVNAWIDGGDRRSFDLDASALRTVPVAVEDLERVAFETPPAVAVYTPPVRQPDVRPEIGPPAERLPGPEVIPDRGRAPLPPVTVSQTCERSVQGQIAWDYNGNTTWNPDNVDRLCRGAEDSPEPARCFDRVMHGGVSHGSGTRWVWGNAIDLCKGTRDADATISCFQSRIAQGETWRQAIAACNTG